MISCHGEHTMRWRERGSKMKLKPNMRVEKERERHMSGKEEEEGDGEVIVAQQVANTLLCSLACTLGIDTSSSTAV